MITVMTNGRGALSAAVGDSLFLPSGREVPLEAAPDWTPSGEAGEEDLRPECLSAARRRAEALLLRAQAAERRSAARRSKIAGSAPRGRRPDRTWEEFVAEAEDVLSRIEDLPERAEDFARGVEELVSGMRDTARRLRHATDQMWTALENVSSGVSGWER